MGWDRPLLDRVVRKVNELARSRVAPLEEEKRQIAGRFQGLRGEIGNLIGLAKAQGSSQEVSEELRRLDGAKRALEARLHEIEAEIGRGRQVVYDADVIQGTLQRFSRFIYKLLIERQVRTIQILVRQVTIFKDRVRVELHELPIHDLQRALDAKVAERGIAGRDFQIPRSSNGGSKIPHAERTGVVESDRKWRGRRRVNATEPADAPVPTIENSQYFPPFSITWPLGWDAIANGEGVIRDHLACPLAEPRIAVGFPHGRQSEYRRLRGRLDSDYRHDRAA